MFVADDELPSSGKVLTLSASRHVFTEDPYAGHENMSLPFGTVVDSAVDLGAADSSLTASELCEEPDNVDLYRTEGRGANGFQKPEVRKTSKKQRSTSKPEKAANEHIQRLKMGPKMKQRDVQQHPISDKLKAKPDNNRYRQKRSAVETGHVVKGNKKDALRRHTIAAPKSTARKQSHADRSSQLPITRRKLEGVQLRVQGVVIDRDSRVEADERATPRMPAVSPPVPGLRKPPKLSGRTPDGQAGGRRKQQLERKTQHRCSGETFTVERCRGELSSPPLPSTRHRQKSVSPVATYVVDGPSELDGSEASSVPSTGDAYRVPVRRTSVTLPSVVDNAWNSTVHRHAAQETDTLHNVQARITSAGGTQSQLFFHDELQDDAEQKREQQTVRPHPLQLPSTTSQVLHETKLYLETRRHNYQQHQVQPELKRDAIQQVWRMLFFDINIQDKVFCFIEERW